MTIFKHFTLLVFTTIAGCTLFSQPAIKVYAFEQAVLPGTIPAGVTDENGNPVATSKAGHTINYFIYLSYSNNFFVTPVSLWIKGNCHEFKTETITSTPITKVNYNIPNRPKTTVLVPVTTNKVTRMLVSEPTETKCTLTATEKKHVAPLNVVIGYKWKSKVYYVTAATLKNLEPVMHQ